MQVCAQSYPRRQAVPSASIERGGGSKLSHAPGYGIYIRSRQIAPIAKFGNHKATTEILVDRGSKLTLKGGRSREGCEFVRQNCGGYETGKLCGLLPESRINETSEKRRNKAKCEKMRNEKFRSFGGYGKLQER